MSSVQLYDTIGTTYTATRRTEPRIAAQIWAALGDARTVVNVGAGTGSAAAARAQPTSPSCCVGRSTSTAPSYARRSFEQVRTSAPRTRHRPRGHAVPPHVAR